MLKKLLLFLALGTAIMMVVMSKTGKCLKTSSTPCGILNLEFAYNAVRADAVINAWAAKSDTCVDIIGDAKTNTLLDFIFIIFYSSLLFAVCKFLSGRVTAFISSAGSFFLKGAIAAGILDICENAGMLFTLYKNANGAVALFTAVAAVVKWALVVVVVLYIIIAWVVLLFKSAVPK